MELLTILLASVLITALCSLLHDGDYLDKASCIIIHLLLTGIFLGAYEWQSWGIAAAVVGIFWPMFRRGWQAKAELTAIRLQTPEAVKAIVGAYPMSSGYVPMWVTRVVIMLPFKDWHRRIQSGLIALLWTGPISSSPIFVLRYLLA